MTNPQPGHGSEDAYAKRQPTPEEMMAEALSMSPSIDDEPQNPAAAQVTPGVITPEPLPAVPASGQVPAWPTSPDDSLVEKARSNGLGVASLGFGIASYFAIPILGSVLAVVTGHLAIGRIKQGGGGSVVPPRVGLALGYVQLGLALIAVCAPVLLAMFGISMFGLKIWEIFGH